MLRNSFIYQQEHNPSTAKTNRFILFKETLPFWLEVRRETIDKMHEWGADIWMVVSAVFWVTTRFKNCAYFKSPHKSHTLFQLHVSNTMKYHQNVVRLGSLTVTLEHSGHSSQRHKNLIALHVKSGIVPSRIIHLRLKMCLVFFHHHQKWRLLNAKLRKGGH